MFLNQKTLFQTALSAVKNTVWNDKFLRDAARLKA
jgi:hypothetical protein